MVAGAPVPFIVVGVRAKLHGTEGDRHAGKAVTVTTRSDARVDPLERVVLNDLRRKGGGTPGH